jgi:hypothetical protein
MTTPFPLAAMIAAFQTKTVNISPKVAGPGFVGFSASTTICILDHYGIKVDTATAVGIVVAIMGLLGYHLPAGVQTPKDASPVTITPTENP